ncbi:terminus macrodomain insulation protein YfbV [Colwellia piezophila]|uniref:terminus macrodomain insulation protein YfbV n=1 Tax=Colwellia piezophila TaxID=211668 RepID=UPI0003656BCC|nr:terminus macrodomain insulation protein YfbV [Colwellia piezophila]
MNISVVQLIKLGQKYLSLWPDKPELTQYFQDYRGVQSARFICRYFPALAMFTFIMQLYVASGYPMGQGSINNAMQALPQALVYGLFLISMPVQALVFSGVKADKFLPPALASWYHSGLAKVKQQVTEKKGLGSKNDNAIADLATYKPRYIDLAKLLQLTFTTIK